MDYERRQFYRGPEKFIDLPTDPKKLEEAIDDALDDHPDNGDLLSAVVLEAGPRKVVLTRGNGDTIEITGEGLKPVQSGLSDKAAPAVHLRRGAVVRIVQMPKGVPVATFAIGAAGAANAALFAVAMLANHDAALRSKLEAFRAEQTAMARAMTLPPVGAA